MKKCSKCRLEKDLICFYKHRTRSDGHQTVCIVCQNKRSRQHYKDNKKYYGDKRRKFRESLREMIDNIKNVPCKDCKVRYNPWQMEFDHLRDKENGISELMILGNKTKILKEIEKCEIVCANCHKQRTHDRLMAE